MTPTVFLLGLYVGVFVWKTLLAREWLWLSISIFTGFYANVLLLEYLPSVWYLGVAGPLFIPYFFMTLGSFVVLLRRQPRHNRHCFLLLWAHSNLILHIAFLLVLMALLWLYPQGRSISAYYALWTIYLFKPVWWIITQCVLGVVLYHSYGRATQHGQGLSVADWRISFYVALLMLLGYLGLMT